MDEDRPGELTGRPRELAEKEDAALAGAGGHEFLGHEVHPVMDGTDHDDMSGLVVGEDVVEWQMGLLEDDGLPVLGLPPLVDVDDAAVDLVVVVPVLADVDPGKGTVLEKDEPADEPRVFLE